MQLIYVHGLDSGPESIKGEMLEDYCRKHHPHITVQRPDLNCEPDTVIKLLLNLIEQDPQTGLVGSSLGGFFTHAIVAKTGKPAVMINPSIRPYESLRRFTGDRENVPKDEVIYTTSGGWGIRPRDIDALLKYKQDQPQHPDRQLVLLKTADEVLNYREALEFYTQPGFEASVLVEPGGDHFMHDLPTKIPLIVKFLFELHPPK